MATIRTRLEAIRWYLYEKGVHPSIITELKNIIEAPFGSQFTGVPTSPAAANIGDLDPSLAVHLNQTGGTGFGAPASVQVPNPAKGPPAPDRLTNTNPKGFNPAASRF